MPESNGVEVLPEAADGNPEVVHVVVSLPLDKYATAGT